MIEIVHLTVIGLIVGSIIGLGAMGLTLTYGILRFANFAHADLMTLGMYLAFFVVGDLGLAGAELGPLSFGWGMIPAALFAIAGVFLALSVPTAGYVAAALLVISFGFNGAASVLLDGQLQRAIRGHARATVTSVAGTGAEVAGISLYLIGGVTAQAASWHDSVAAFAAIALLLVAAFSFGATARGE